MALVSLAGPTSNLLMALVAVWLRYILLAIGQGNIIFNSLAYFFYLAAEINIMLCVFNFLPIPPLDGSKIFSAILPDKIYFKIMSYDRYIMIGVMILLFTGLLTRPISWLADLLMRLISIIPALIFG